MASMSGFFHAGEGFSESVAGIVIECEDSWSEGHLEGFTAHLSCFCLFKDKHWKSIRRDCFV